MHTGRLEAFSDGVLAIIITIMVLALRTPDGFTLRDLWNSTGIGLLSYVLSFVYVGIYWNNHHHIFQLVERVNGAVLWSNLHLLFWLSLVPFTTEWMARSEISATPTVLYAVNLLMASVAYWVLELAIVRLPGEGTGLADAVGKADRKAITSTGLYVVAAATAAFWPLVGLAILVGVALLWMVPDRRIERSVG